MREREVQSNKQRRTLSHFDSRPVNFGLPDMVLGYCVATVVQTGCLRSRVLEWRAA